MDAPVLVRFLMRVTSVMSGGMNIPHIKTGHEPNSELDKAGWCVPVVD